MGGPPPRRLELFSSHGEVDSDFHVSICAGIVLTNDGNAILREIDVTHPAAKVRETQGATSRDLMISNVLPLQTVSGVVDQNLS